MVERSEQEGERIAALAARLRASGTLGRSDLMNLLFEFLLDQSIAGRSPKEIEVAQEVFGKDSRFDMGQDASVRVYIHRLRRKLEEVGFDPNGERLTIPRGEYRVAIQSADAPVAAEELDEPDPADLAILAKKPRRRWWMAATLCLALAVGVAIGALVSNARDPSPGLSALGRTSFWRPLVESTRPTLLVVGDYYIFGDAPKSFEITRLIREFSINSREDLDEYMMTNPSAAEHYVNLDLYYLPVSVADALRDLLPLANGFTARGNGGFHPLVITTSRLTPEILKRANILYSGYFSSLGLLRSPLFQASGFNIGDSYDELIDRATGKHYLSDWQTQTDTQTPRRDYAYLATFPGPSGNRVWIVAGTRDPAVMQASEIAGDKAQLDLIQSRAGKAEAFEALYEVSTLGTLNVSSRLVVARPIKPNGIWQPNTMPSAFPDQMPPPDKANFDDGHLPPQHR